MDMKTFADGGGLRYIRRTADKMTIECYVRAGDGGNGMYWQETRRMALDYVTLSAFSKCKKEKSKTKRNFQIFHRFFSNFNSK